MRTILKSTSIEPNVNKRWVFFNDIYLRFPWTSRYARVWMTIALGITDLATLLFAWVLAVLLRMAISSEMILEPFIRIVPLIILFLLVYYGRGLYPAIGISPVEEISRLAGATSVVYLALTTFAFFMKSPPTIYSRAVFALSWLLALVLVPLGRAIIRTIGARIQFWGEPVAIIGESDKAKNLIDYLRNDLRIGFRPLVFFARSTTHNSISDIPIYPEELIAQICKKRNIRSALVVSKGLNGGNNEYLENIEDVFDRITLVDSNPNPYMLWISLRNLGEIMGLEIQYNLVNPWSQSFKRLIDVIGSLLMLIFLMPVFVFVTLMIKLDSPGPILFSQERLGWNGKKFRMIKFRTMYQNAEQMLTEYLNTNPSLEREWNEYQKLLRDPRVTRVGRILRRFSIDELPQLINVLKGEMSLVGPRPFFPEQLEIYGNAYMHYVRVRPGITGMWQVSGRNLTSFQERSKWDEYYVRNWSIWLDMYILARTFSVVLLRDGAY